MSQNSKKRCPWLNMSNDLYIKYHDTEWGQPIYDDNQLFEMLILEGAQAGLSWETILNKRAHYRTAFENFDPYRVAQFTSKQQAALMLDAGIVRNKLKIASAVINARAFLAIQDAYGSFSSYIWDFVDNKPICNDFTTLCDYPSETPLSIAISKDLKKRGFKFVGPTIIYAFMQAIGMVNDHSTDCYLYHRKTNKQWSVYILECQNGTLYTGISTDVDARVKTHTEGGAHAAKYLRGKGPFKLLYQKCIGSKSDALKEELRIKKMKKSDKMKLINNRVCKKFCV